MIIFHVEGLQFFKYTTIDKHGKMNALYSYLNKKHIEKIVLIHPNKNKLMIDSGAYGAYTRGVNIDLIEYCEWLKQNNDKMDYYVALDVIGNWRESADNLSIMLRMGLNPIPVFHLGSPLNELDRLCKEHKYIGLGGMVQASRNRELLKQWLDNCWSIIKIYWPIKIHGFGLTAIWALERYPFYSVDSTTVLKARSMGKTVQFNKYNLRQVDRKNLPDSLQIKYFKDIDKMQSDGNIGIKINYEQFMIAEKYITSLWKSRGITWPD